VSIEEKVDVLLDGVKAAKNRDTCVKTVEVAYFDLWIKDWFQNTEESYIQGESVRCFIFHGLNAMSITLLEACDHPL